MKLKTIQINTNDPNAYLKAVAKNVGCKSEKEITEFLSANPQIHNTISKLPDYIKARNRLKKSIMNKEHIVIYGDYDCDGITSLVQMIDMLEVAGHNKVNISWFIPNRMTDSYGLTRSGLERCIAEHKPSLLISVDCGSSSINEINWLKKKGIDCIVIDHHEVAPQKNQHPAIAHLNPKAFSGKNPSMEKLTSMSASGLTFLFCEQFINDYSIDNWNRNRALILAGLGTIVDVMPLIGNNRALVKHSLRLANDENELKCIPGLVALKNVSKTGEIKSYTYGFQWGPRLNATGRLVEAIISVKLLLSKTLNEAEPFAEKCNKTNIKRQSIQEKILKEAYVEAKSLVDIHKHKVLILNKKSWHTGIVGIVASKIKDQFNRPVIVCGWDKKEECWKGSGRSVDGFDLGDAIESAVKKGILSSGGGHKMACGLSFHNKKLNEIQNWMNNKCSLSEEDFVPSYTVLGYAFDQEVDVWLNIFEHLEPFGNGNPRPFVYINYGKLMWLDEKKTRDGKVWAIKAGFRCQNGPDKLLYFLWSNVDRAIIEWQKGNNYQMVLNVNKSVKEYNGEKITYYNWHVKDSEQV